MGTDDPLKECSDALTSIMPGPSDYPRSYGPSNCAAFIIDAGTSIPTLSLSAGLGALESGANVGMKGVGSNFGTAVSIAVGAVDVVAAARNGDVGGVVVESVGIDLPPGSSLAVM